MFLELRQVVAHLMGAGPMRRLVDEMAEVFADPLRTRLNLVTLPDELPVSETLELHARLSATRSVAFGRVFVNRVPSTGLAGQADVVMALREAAARGGDAELWADAELTMRALDAERAARRQIERLRQGLTVQIVELPRLGAARMPIADLHRLGGVALGSFAAGEACP
jgi:hypothetical protein